MNTPIVTHWSNATQSFSFGAFDKPPFSPPALPPFPYTWGPAFLPDYNNYIASNYSVHAIPYLDALSRMFDLGGFSGGVPFRLLDPKGDLLAKLQHNVPCVQVLHGLVVNNSIATIMLPPFWNKFAPAGTYPILAQGLYDVNSNVFTGSTDAAVIARAVAQSGLNGRTGAIGVIWNGGGTLSTATINDNARQQFAAVIDLVAQYSGGDRHRILMFGGSRGGTTALMMASNPDHLNYTVKWIFAGIPGTKTGTHFALAGPTYPRTFGGSGGFEDAWRPGWTYPPSGRPNLVGLTAKQVTYQILVGTTDATTADLLYAPISDRFVNGLLAAGTQVLLNFGSHDEFIPHATQLEYLQKLRVWGVPTEAHIVLRGGHSELYAMRDDRIDKALRSYIEPGAPTSWGTVANGAVYWYRVNRSNGQAELLPQPPQHIPFSLEVPYRVFAGMPITVVATGEPWTHVSVTGYNNGVPMAPPFTCVIDGTYMCVITANSSALGGITMTYQATITKPGLSPQAVDMTNIAGAPLAQLTTEVLGGPVPMKTAAEAYNLYWQSPNKFGGWGFTTWGVSEY